MGLQVIIGRIDSYKTKITGLSDSPIWRDRHQVVIFVKAILENTQ
jgi:hypothetical protein